MAAMPFSHHVTVSHGGAAKTVSQILVAANHRVYFLGANLGPQGSTNTDPPIVWNWGTQDGAGTSDPATADLKKGEPSYSEALAGLVTARDAFTAEPAHTNRHMLTLHEMASMPLWVPVGGPTILNGGERWALKCLSAISETIDYQLYFEV